MQASLAAEQHSVSANTQAWHNEAVQRVILGMRAHLDQPFSLQSLAMMANASPFHFNRTFRRITGIPPFQFLYALRLETAKRLILTTDASVIDVCYDVGYNSLGTFTRRFTELVGLPPTRLRSMARTPLERMLRPADSPSDGARGRHLTGHVFATPEFHGLIFVGLFETPIPQGKPVACTIVSQTGPYVVREVPEGKFYLFALAIPLSADRNAYFQYSSALRGGGQHVSVSAGTVVGETEIRLRPAAVTDPPILLVLPWLMRRLETIAARTASPSEEYPVPR
jgi:AraC family transcriptional regulator